jgi:hypothetical protein
MTRRNNSRHTLFCCLIYLVTGSLPLSLQAESENILRGLPYDENFVQEKITQFTLTADAPDAAVKAPSYLSYKLAFRKILSDKKLQAQIAAHDLELIKNLPAPSDHSFLAKDRKEINTVCIQTNNIETPAEIVDVAAKYDESRRRSERDLDVFYDSSLESLAAETRMVLQNLLLEIGARKQITYTTFDMAGFAQEVPEVAKALLIMGCENFSVDVLAYTPQPVKLGDLKPVN